MGASRATSDDVFLRDVFLCVGFGAGDPDGHLVLDHVDRAAGIEVLFLSARDACGWTAAERYGSDESKGG